MARAPSQTREGACAPQNSSRVFMSFVIRASAFISRIHRRWIHLRSRREITVDRYQHSVAQFENSRAYDGFIRLQSVDDRDEIAARFAHPDKLLTNRLRFLTRLRVLLFLDHKNRIPKRRV